MDPGAQTESSGWLRPGNLAKLLLVFLVLALLAAVLPFESFLGSIAFVGALELGALALYGLVTFLVSGATNWWGARAPRPGETTRRSHLLRRSYAFALEPERVQLDVFPSPLGHPYLLLALNTLVFGAATVAAAQDAARALLDANQLRGDAIWAAIVLALIWAILSAVVVAIVPRRIQVLLEARGPLWCRVERLLGAPKLIELERTKGLSLLESPTSGTWSFVIGSPEEGIWGVLLSGALPVDPEIAGDVERLQEALSGLADLGSGHER